jgi:hypothetical protein
MPNPILKQPVVGQCIDLFGPEDFYVISGEVLALRKGAHGYESHCVQGQRLYPHGQRRTTRVAQCFERAFCHADHHHPDARKFSFPRREGPSSRRPNLRHPMILRGWRRYPRNAVTGTLLRKRTRLSGYGFDRASPRHCGAVVVMPSRRARGQPPADRIARQEPFESLSRSTHIRGRV